MCEGGALHGDLGLCSSGMFAVRLVLGGFGRSSYTPLLSAISGKLPPYALFLTHWLLVRALLHEQTRCPEQNERFAGRGARELPLDGR